MLLTKFIFNKPIDFTASDWRASAYQRVTMACGLDPAAAMLSTDMHQHMAALFIEAIEAAEATELDTVRAAVHRSFRASPLDVFGSGFLDHLTNVILYSLFLRVG